MTIYTNEARVINSMSDHSKTDNESNFYDPRYSIIEIGAQNSLNGQLIRLTVNSGQGTSENPETCFIFKFNGSLKGTHYTLEELKHFDPSFSMRIIESSNE